MIYDMKREKMGIVGEQGALGLQVFTLQSGAASYCQVRNSCDLTAPPDLDSITPVAV